MATVDFSATARRDLVGIVRVIAAERPNVARRMRDRIVEACLHHAEQPGLGRSFDDLRPGVAGFLVGPYWVFYVAVPSGIRVVRILHGRRDWPRLIGRR